MQKSAEYRGGLHGHFDRLYGTVPISERERKLLGTPALKRLSHIALDPIPSILYPDGFNVTRFEHSVGAGHLAGLVGKKPGFLKYENELRVAAFFHDAGHPPFSHATEPFQQAAMGVTHEENIVNIFDRFGTAAEIRAHGCDPEIVVAFIQGKYKPYSDVISGSLDVDNLDNILRWQKGTFLGGTRLYSPENIAHSFALQNGELVLSGDISADLAGWEMARKVSYDYLYGPEHVRSATMLNRSLYFAFQEGELSEEFFFMTDPEALSYLQTQNPRTQTLLHRMQQWALYDRIFAFETHIPNQPIMKAVNDTIGTNVMADTLSQELGVNPEDVCLHVDKSRAVRPIHIPLITPNGERVMLAPSNHASWLVEVYANPDTTGIDQTTVEDFMHEKFVLSA